MADALGMIETRGFAALVEASDAMVKAAKVKFLSRQKVKGGLVAIMVAGDVGAVKAAVDAGAAAGKRVGTVVSSHVIPRPHNDIDAVIPGSPQENPKPEPKKEPKKNSGPKKTKRSKK